MFYDVTMCQDGFKMYRLISGIVIACFVFGSAGLAFAGDACLKLDSNPEWTQKLEALTTHYKEKKFDEALKDAEILNKICDRSPILNYSIGRIYKEMGNDTKALYYTQRATLYTEEFAVRGKVLEQMWSERYEAEHPEARPEAIAKKDSKIAELEAQVADANKMVVAADKRIQTLEMELSKQQTDSRMSSHDEIGAYSAGLWTGVAMGSAGVVLTAVGAGLYVTQKDDAIEYEHEVKEKDLPKAHVKQQNYMHMGMMWAGVALSVAGGIVAGIFGYHYANASKDNANDTVSFGISNTGASLSFSF